MSKYGVSHKENPAEYVRVASKARRRANPIRYLVNQARYRAKKKGEEFTIDWQDLEVPEFCPVFGIKLSFEGGKRTAASFSLDRLDNSKGYTVENTRVVSWRANQYKGDLTIKEVEALLKYMKGK